MIAELPRGPGAAGLALAAAWWLVWTATAVRRVVRRLVDVTRDPVDGCFSLAYLLFEVFLMVGGRDAQRATLDNLLPALRPGGHLGIEASVFDVDQWLHYVDGAVRVSAMQPGRVVLGTSLYDRSTNRLDYHDILIGADGVRLVPLSMYPISPAELDRLAAAVGLTRVALWSDWHRTPYVPGAPSMIAVFRRD